MTLKAGLILSLMSLAAPASAAVLFADDFQGNLGQWGANHSGVIVAAPGGGNALAFTANIGGGDIFTASPIGTSGTFTISFDYLGTCATGQQCGGFVGFNNAAGETWLAGSGPYPSLNPIVETGAWQTITFNFTSASPFTLKIEDWDGGTDGPTPGNAYFRNLSISGAVPEPTSWAMLIAGFGMVGAAARRRRVSVAA